MEVSGDGESRAAFVGSLQGDDNVYPPRIIKYNTRNPRISTRSHLRAFPVTCFQRAFFILEMEFAFMLNANCSLGNH